MSRVHPIFTTFLGRNLAPTGDRSPTAATNTIANRRRAGSLLVSNSYGSSASVSVVSNSSKKTNSASGPFPRRGEVPSIWRSSEAGHLILNFASWFRCGKDIAKSRAVSKEMYAKVNAEIVSIAQSRGMQIFKADGEMYSTNAIAEAMGKAETSFLCEDFSNAEQSLRRWPRGPNVLDESRGKVELQECRVISKNGEDVKAPNHFLRITGPLAHSRCHSFSGVYSLLSKQGRRNRKPTTIKFKCRVLNRCHQGAGCVALLSQISLIPRPGPLGGVSSRAGIHSEAGVGQLPRGGALSPTSGSVIVSFLEDGISCTGCPLIGYEKNRWYSMNVQLKWPSMEKCSCQQGAGKVCEMEGQELGVEFSVDDQFVGKSRICGDSQMLHHGFVALALYNNTGHRSNLQPQRGTTSPAADWGDIFVTEDSNLSSA